MSQKIKFSSLAILLVSLFFIEGCVTRGRYLSEVRKTETLEKELNETIQDNLRLQRERRGIRSRLYALKRRESHSELQRLAQTNEIRKKLEQIISLTLQQEKMKHMFGQLEVDRKKLARHMSELSGKLSEKNIKVSSLQEHLDDVVKQTTLLKQTLAEAKKTSEKKTHHAKAALQTRAILIETLQGKIKIRNTKINELTEIKKNIEQKKREAQEMLHTRELLIESLQDEIKKGNITISKINNQLSVQIVDRILFASGSNQITGKGKDLLKKVSRTLRNIKKKIRIEGHTDNVPIRGLLRNKFSTNWELSTSRATQVVRVLIEEEVNPDKLVAVGMSQYHPIASNDSSEGREKNRRIEIVLMSRSPF